MRLLKRFVFGLPGFLMLAIVAIYLTSLDTCVPEVEQAFFYQIYVQPETAVGIKIGGLFEKAAGQEQR